MHHDEHHIALLAAREDLLAADAHVRECAACRERVEFLRELTVRFAHESERPPDPRIAAAVHSAGELREIPLVPFRHRPEVREERERYHITLLAAQEPRNTERTPEAEAVFASEAEATLVRIVGREEPGIYRVYVLASDPEKQRRVLCGFVTASGEHVLVATDDRGAARCESRAPIDWRDASAVLYLPIAEFSTPGGLAPGAPMRSGSAMLTIEPAEDHLLLRCGIDNGPTPRRALLTFADGCAKIVEAVAGFIALAPSHAAAIRSIRLFH
jgi:hypothetical protein